MMPPRTIAAQTCRCVRLAGPDQASGDTQSANTMPAIHWKPIRPANSRSVCLWISCWYVREELASARRLRGSVSEW